MTDGVSHEDLKAILKERDANRVLAGKAIAAEISEDVTRRLTAVLNNGLTSRIIGVEKVLDLRVLPGLDSLVTGQETAMTEVGKLRRDLEARPCLHESGTESCPLIPPPPKNEIPPHITRRQKLLIRLASWPSWVVPSLIALSFAAGLGVKALWPLVSKLF